MNRFNLKKILIIRTDALGDFISIIPVIRTLRKNFPEAKITVLGSKANKDLASLFTEIDLFINKDEYEKKYWKLVREIRQEKYDLSLVFKHDTKWAYLPVLGGIKNRIGDKYRLGITFLFNKGVYTNNADYSQHVLEYNLQYLKCLGLKDEDMVRDIQLKTKFPQKFSQLNNTEYLVLHVGRLNGTRGRIWTPEAYARIINTIHKQKLIIIVLTGQNFFADFTSKILAKVENKKYVLNFNEKTSILDLISLLQNAVAYIGTSTGITHLAAVCGVSVLMLKIVKAEKPIRWYPYGVAHDVVGTERLSCPYVCHAKCKKTNCLDNVDYDDIVIRLLALLSGNFDAEKSFRNTLSVLVFYNQQTEDLKNKVVNNLNKNKIRVIERNNGNIFHIGKIWKLVINEDITVIQCLTLSSYFFAKILGQFLPIVVFVKPLVIAPSKTKEMLEGGLGFFKQEMQILSEKPNQRFWDKNV